MNSKMRRGIMILSLTISAVSMTLVSVQTNASDLSSLSGDTTMQSNTKEELATGVTGLKTTKPASNKVLKVINENSPLITTKAKPARNIKVVINGKPVSMKDPMLMENGRVFLPLRNIGDLLGVGVDYLPKERIAVAYNNKAYLELPIGYNQAVKDEVVLLPVDTNNKDTRIFTYNNRTYLPVRFVAENLGFQISYSQETVYINTDGTVPTPTPKPTPKPTPVPTGELDISKIVPTDPTNPHNLQAFKDSRAVQLLPTVSARKIKMPAGMSKLSWSTFIENDTKFVMVNAKLSEFPRQINDYYDGKESTNPKGILTIATPSVKKDGTLGRAGRAGACQYIYFKDGTRFDSMSGGDASVGINENDKVIKNHKVSDITSVVIIGSGEYGYLVYVTGP